MNFNIFDEQLNTRRENDRQVFEGAFADLASILGMDVKGEKAKEKEQAARGAIEEILLYLGAKIPEVPESITDMHAQLEYMLRPSGVMHRRVELVGAWWKDAVGALLGSTMDGDVIAILPARFAGRELKGLGCRGIIKVCSHVFMILRHVLLLNVTYTKAYVSYHTPIIYNVDLNIIT